jgi:hypothetical protein
MSIKQVRGMVILVFEQNNLKVRETTETYCLVIVDYGLYPVYCKECCSAVLYCNLNIS